MADETGGDGPVESQRIDVRPASDDDLPAVMNVLDAAMLDVDLGAVRDRLTCRDGDETGACDGVLVAVEEDRVLGVCVIDASGGGNGLEGGNPAHVDAIAVRPGRRGQGIGSALIEEAVARWGPLSAEFDERVRPFYESLGFGVELVGDDRFHGYRSDDG